MQAITIPAMTPALSEDELEVSSNSTASASPELLEENELDDDENVVVAPLMLEDEYNCDDDPPLAAAVEDEDGMQGEHNVPDGQHRNPGPHGTLVTLHSRTKSSS